MHINKNFGRNGLLNGNNSDKLRQDKEVSDEHYTLFAGFLYSGLHTQKTLLHCGENRTRQLHFPNFVWIVFQWSYSSFCMRPDRGINNSFTNISHIPLCHSELRCYLSQTITWCRSGLQTECLGLHWFIAWSSLSFLTVYEWFQSHFSLGCSWQEAKRDDVFHLLPL